MAMSTLSSLVNLVNKVPSTRFKKLGKISILSAVDTTALATAKAIDNSAVAGHPISLSVAV